MWGILKKDLSEFVSVIRQDTTEVIKTGIETVVAQVDLEGVSQQRGVDQKHGPAEAAVQAMRADPKTYTQDIADADQADYAAFIKGFDLNSSTSDVSAILQGDLVVTGLHAQLVPAEVSYEMFWTRYFYRLSRLTKPSRMLAFRPLEDTDEDDDFGWGEDEEEQKGPKAPAQAAMKQDDPPPDPQAAPAALASLPEAVIPPTAPLHGPPDPQPQWEVGGSPEPPAVVQAADPAAVERVAQLESEVSSLKAQLESQAGQAERLGAEVAELRAARDALQGQLEEALRLLLAERDQVAAVTADRDELAHRSAALQRTLQDADSGSAAHVAEALERKGAWQRERAELQREVQGLQEERTLMLRAREDMTRETEAHSQRGRQLQEMVDALQERLSSSEAKVAHLEQELTAADLRSIQNSDHRANEIERGALLDSVTPLPPPVEDLQGLAKAGALPTPGAPPAAVVTPQKEPAADTRATTSGEPPAAASSGEDPEDWGEEGSRSPLRSATSPVRRRSPKVGAALNAEDGGDDEGDDGWEDWS